MTNKQSVEEKAIKERFKKLKNGKYKYTPKQQVMFGRDIEKIFEKESQQLKQE